MSNFGLAFLLSYMGCVYATFFVDLSWGVYLYVMQYWLNPVDRWWYGGLPQVRWSFTVAFCILIAFILKRQKYAKNRLFNVPQTKWYLMNVIVVIIISSWAVWPQMHSKFLQDHIKLLIFIFIAYKGIDTPKKFDGMMWACMLGSFYVAYETRNMGRNADGRVEGTGPADSGADGNNCAASLLGVIPMLMFFVVKSNLVKTKLWKRGVLLFLLAFVMLAIVLINSRGSFIGLVLSCTYMGLYIFLNKKVTMKQRFQLIALVMLGICAFLYMADDAFWERIEGISKETESDTGGGGRKLFWKIAREEVLRDYPWGAGGWGFAYLSPQYVPQEYMPANAGIRAVHSLYFQCLAERGYWGTFVFVGFILSNFFI